MAKKQRGSKKTQGKKKASLKKKRAEGSAQLVGKEAAAREALVKAKRRDEKNKAMNRGLVPSDLAKMPAKTRLALVEPAVESLENRVRFLEKHINPWIIAKQKEQGEVPSED